MSREYQAFAISNFRSGFAESVEPWLLPRDAYQSMINAHLYRGVIEKIEGYTLFATMSYRNLLRLTGSGRTWTGTITMPTSSNFFGYGTISAGSTAEIFSYASDDGVSVVTLAGTAGGTGTINLSTLVVTLNFNSNVPDADVLFEWDSAPGTLQAIMGIKQYYNANSSQEVLVFDQKRVGSIVNNLGIFATNSDTLQAISEIPHAYYQSQVFTGNGSTTTFTGTLTQKPLVPGTVTFTQYTSTGAIVNNTVNGLSVSQAVTDNGTGGLLGPNVTSGSINYATGAYSLTFTTAPASGNYFDVVVGIYGNLFTGSISNFFSLTNYQYKAFFCNGVDPIFYYDGTTIQYLNTNLSVKPVTSGGGVPSALDITTTLHVFVNRNRLLLISPTVTGIPQVNAIFWSQDLNPLDFTNDEQEYADTSQSIRAIGYINSDLIVRFANSERVFRFTGDAFAPFRFDSTNNIWACDAPYSSINYDSWFSSVGRPALVGSDGVNVKRVDEVIPDFTDPSRIPDQLPVPFMSQTSIQQCYGERFDDIKEGWLCYNSQPEDESEVTASDNVLAFNYLDSTYAVYTFPFSCLGFGRIINVPTWDTTFTKWSDASDTWDSYQAQANGLVDLAGDQFDNIYELNSGNTYGDGVTPILMSVISKNFNPYIEDGQMARLGYVDLFVSANIETTLRVQFYVNDQLYIDSTGNPAGFYQETILTFAPTDSMSPNTDQKKVWKRIYVGAVAKEHTIRFYQNALDFDAETLDQPIYIHSMVLWMKPAGIIFN